MTLRDYQLKAVENTLAGFDQFGKQLLVCPTGGGKTLLFAEMAKRLQPARTLILAHRDELVNQAVDKLHAATGIYAEVEKAEAYASDFAPVVVGSVQTMRGARLGRWPEDHFRLVVADEAHHAIAKSWQGTLNHFDSHAWVLGVTATPDRGDRKNLGQYFENVPFEISLFELINQGYLSRIAVKSVPLQIDLRKVKTTAGDYSADDLGDALAPYLDEIARRIADEAKFRRTLVFVPLITTSLKFVEACKAAGINAEHIDGNSPDRKEILARFAAGEIDLLSNAMLLTEGFDDPGIDCVVILRPTKSRALYSQMVGRGTRTAPGKSNLLLLDFLWLHEQHRLIRPAHLVAKSEDEAEQITELSQQSVKVYGGELEYDLQGLATDAAAQREARLRKELEAKAKKKARYIDPVEFGLSLGSFIEYEPSMPWECGAPSKAQLEKIARLSVGAFDVDTISNAGMASKIIELLDTRMRLGLATPKQIRFLRQQGHPNPETCSFADAGKFIGGVIGGRGRKAA